MKKNQRDLWFAQRCALALAAATLCYLLFGILGVGCLWWRTAGLPCPSCGMSRAWLCALSADLSGAFFWHPLFWTIPPLALLLIFAGAGRRWVQRVLILCAVLFAAVYLVRMALLFPHTAPMTVNPNGLLPRLFSRYFYG